jgi:hypothetical protein
VRELARSRLIPSVAFVGQFMGCDLRLKLAGEQVAHAPPCHQAVIGF